MKAFMRITLLLLGAALFGWFIHDAGPKEILATLTSLDARAPLMVLSYLFVYLLDNAGWHFAFSGKEGPFLPYWTLFRIRMAGEAVNNVIPSAYIGGEAAKVYLAKKCGMPAIRGGASVVVGKTTQTLAEVIFIAAAAWLALSIVEPGSAIHRGMLFVTFAASGIVVMLFAVQRYGMFAGLLRVTRLLRFKIRILEENEEHLKRLDERIFGFYREEPLRFAASTFFYLAGWAAGTLEILFVAWLLGIEVHWTQAVAIEAFTAVAKGVGIFVPGALGVQESGIAFLCRILGLPDAMGISYAILRRAREVIYVLLGGFFLAREGVSLGEIADDVRAEERELAEEK